MFVALFLAHLVGNNLLKNDYVMLNKSSFKSVGWWTCIIHSIIYTATIYFFTKETDIIFLVSVFLVHFSIDKFNLGEIWLEITKSRSLIWVMRNQKSVKVDEQTHSISMMNAGDMLNASFAVLNNFVINLTLHLVPLYYILKRVMKWEINERKPLTHQKTLFVLFVAKT